MSYSERQGDLFAATDLDGIAHGVNCHGQMGAGIAKIIREKYPE
jgi:O-acetyl-ADP-ribose deacetylase (regulator of RNase III)